MIKHNIIGALALILCVCMVASTAAISSDDSAVDSPILASSVSSSLLNIGDTGTASISVSGATVSIVVSGTNSSWSYHWVINWGDSSSTSTSTNRTDTLTHTYSANGSYTVQISQEATLNGEEETDLGSNSVTIMVEPNDITLTLVTSGGSAVSSLTTSTNKVIEVVNGRATIPEGTVIKAPETYRDGYVLTRWTDGSGLAFNFSQPITSNQTLTAEWVQHFTTEINQNVVTLNINSALSGYTNHAIDWGDGSTSDTQTLSATHTYAAQRDFTITVTSSNFDTVSRSSATISITHLPSIVTYTVTFNSNGGTAVTAQSVDTSEKVVKPADPTRSGYEFGGWYTDRACTQAYDFNNIVTQNLTLYASWTEVQPVTDDDTEKYMLYVAIVVILALIAYAAYRWLE